MSPCHHCSVGMLTPYDPRLAILDEMRRHGPTPEVISLATAVDACVPWKFSHQFVDFFWLGFRIPIRTPETLANLFCEKMMFLVHIYTYKYIHIYIYIYTYIYIYICTYVSPKVEATKMIKGINFNAFGSLVHSPARKLATKFWQS